MSNIPGDLLDAYRAMPVVLEKVLEGCTQAQAARGGDENWSIVEIICHLRDCEERGLERLRLMRDRDDPFLESYDQDVWARERDYAASNLREALAGFLRFREQHISELEALRPEDWERTGRHEEQGRITITAQTIHLVAHDAIHTAQIAGQL